MIEIEMQNTKILEIPATRLTNDRLERSGTPSEFERRFACQLATSVWLSQLGDEEAGQAIAAYVMARHRNRRARARLRATLESEYRLCRERLDLCS